MEACGFCHGTGRVPGRKYDNLGHPTHGPDLIVCEHCGGAGERQGGCRLLPATLRPDPEQYGPDARRVFGRS